MFIGNGGSAADAQHLAAEFVSRFSFDRSGLPAIALTTDTSVLTAVGNDYGFEKIFSRQIESIGGEDDLLVAISTSGTSRNIISAIEAARARGITTVGMTGENGKEMAAICDMAVRVPSVQTAHIQEAHITLGHIVCGLVETEFFGRNGR
jgi:D-sedoheptulose 7-phosphate isomerase